MSDERRMDAHCEACHSGSKPERFRGGGDASNHPPDKWAVPLFTSPRMIVIRDESERESDFLRPLGKPYQRASWKFLARKGVTEFNHKPPLQFLRGGRVIHMSVISSA